MSPEKSFAATAQETRQPGGIEKLPAAALGRRLREERFLEHLCQKRFQGSCTCRPCAAGIERLLKMALRPEVHQAIARSRVESENGGLARQQGDVGHAPYVDHRPIFRRVGKHYRMEPRYQRRPLASGCHVSAAQIGHDLDSRNLRKRRWIADLDSKSLVRAMPDGLPMAPDGTNLRRRHPCPQEDQVHRVRILLCQDAAEAASAFDLVESRNHERKQ